MKRIVYFLILPILSTRLFAQEGEVLYGNCQDFNYQKVENGLNDFRTYSTDKIKYNWTTELERELINGFFEQIIEFTKEVQEEDNADIYTIYTYRIKLIKKKEGKIAYYKVINVKNVKSNGKWVPTEIVLKEDSNNTFEQLKIDFKNAYFQPLNLEGLFETEIVYGNHCGIDGMEPEYRARMNKLVESKDVKTLNRWLRSTTVEIQLYAIEGILTLKNEGVYFDKPVFDLIELIEKKEGTAYICSGCSYWNQPIKEIIERIRREDNND